MTHRFCRWCKLLAGEHEPTIEYGSKVYHEACFDTLVQIAHRTQGQL